jgi:hypothetical protein
VSRPPKGPRVPPRPSDTAKAQLTRLKPLIDTAIDTLHQGGRADLAEAVQELAERTPGWGGRGPKAPDSFKADAALMKRIAERFPDRTVTSIAEDGARRFLAGHLDPAPPPGRGAPDSKIQVNIRVDVDLLRDLRQRCEVLSDPKHPDYAGHRVRPVNVYIAALQEAAAAE